MADFQIIARPESHDSAARSPKVGKPSIVIANPDLSIPQIRHIDVNYIKLENNVPAIYVRSRQTCEPVPLHLQVVDAPVPGTVEIRIHRPRKTVWMIVSVIGGIPQQ